MRYDGIVVSKRKSAKTGRWSGHIKCSEFGFDVFYPFRDGEENTIQQGSKVSFETAPDRFDPSKVIAIRLSPVGGNVHQARENPAGQAQNPPRSMANASGQAQTAPGIAAKYYLPKDTSAILYSAMIDNTALKVEKYIPVSNAKEEKLKVVRAHEYTQPEMVLHRDVVRSQLDVLASYRYNHCITAALGSRMVLGLGSGSVLETGIILHHVYGFPFIPGSSLKGCLRSYIIRDLFDNIENAATADGDFVNLFGARDYSGKAFFLDAYPANCKRLELDIMNPHFPEYYQGKADPTDDQSPTPIKFYTVPEGTQFTFRIVSKKLDIKRHAVRGKAVPALLSEMLQGIGIGAKTAVGYGWFSRVEDIQL